MMKVQITRGDEWFSGLAEQIRLEGDQIVESGGEIEISSGQTIPLIVLRSEVLRSPVGREDFVTVRWFDGKFANQTAFVIPIYGHMNEDLGCPVFSGCVGKYTHHFEFDRTYESPDLIEALIEMRFKGPVCVYWMGLREGMAVSKIVVGMVPELIFPLLEGLSVKISDFLSSPLSVDMKESKVLGAVVSRYPWPAVVECDQFEISGLSPSVLKHFWTHEVQSHRHSFYSTNPLIGMATAWSSESFSEANRRVLRTMRSLQIPLKQYRTDLDFRALRKMEYLETILQGV
jgi:hypothetical protein